MAVSCSTAIMPRAHAHHPDVLPHHRPQAREACNPVLPASPGIHSLMKSSGRNSDLPAASRRTMPSPRRPLVRRKRGSPSKHSAVEWNWTYSRSDTIPCPPPAATPPPSPGRRWVCDGVQWQRAAACGVWQRVAACSSVRRAAGGGRRAACSGQQRRQQRRHVQPVAACGDVQLFSS
jgi:hypothetical protein